MRWLCARGLARLWSLGESERPPPVALLTALLPAEWEEATAKDLATVLEEPICPGGLVDGGGRMVGCGATGGDNTVWELVSKFRLA